jgi:acyl-coenzyme A thioesterase PaaI-like protein
MTRELKVEYLRPVPSKTPIRIEGRVHSHEGRKYFAEAAIFDEQQRKFATATGMFIELLPKSS